MGSASHFAAPRVAPAVCRTETRWRLLITQFGRLVSERVNGTLESQPSTGILDVFILGGADFAAAGGIVEIEQATLMVPTPRAGPGC